MDDIALDLYIGNEVTLHQINTGNYPSVKCGDVNSGLSVHFEKCISFVNPDLIVNKKYFEHGDLLIGKNGDSKTSGTAVAYLGNEKCLLGDAVYCLKHTQNPKYLAYAFSTSFVRKQIINLTQESSVRSLYLRFIKKIQIPLPSLEEQEKIPLLLQLNRKRLDYFINKLTQI